MIQVNPGADGGDRYARNCIVLCGLARVSWNRECMKAVASDLVAMLRRASAAAVPAAFLMREHALLPLSKAEQLFGYINANAAMNAARKAG